MTVEQDSGKVVVVIAGREEVEEKRPEKADDSRAIGNNFKLLRRFFSASTLLRLRGHPLRVYCALLDDRLLTGCTELFSRALLFLSSV